MARRVGKKKIRPSPEIEEAERELPEEVLEMVISKMPFPSLFKARILSKCWNLKFPLKNTPHESPSQLMSCEASAFQSQVTTNSAKWGTYAPVFVNWTSNLLLAFDRSESKWFATLPPNILRNPGGNRDWRPSVWLAGALVLVGAWQAGESETTLSVGNVITGSCRHLTSLLTIGEEGPLCLIAESCDSYKVLAVFYMKSERSSFTGDLLCVLYDSNVQFWTPTLKKNSDNAALNGLWILFDHYAYMDGKIYFLAYYNEEDLPSVKLVTYDLDNTSWTIIREGFAEIDDDEDYYPGENSGVFRCGDKFVVVVMSHFAVRYRRCTSEERNKISQKEEYVDAAAAVSVYSIQERGIQVFQLDIQSLELVLISDGPPAKIMGLLEFFGSKYPNWTNQRLSADANFLYFGWDRLPSSVVKFDLTRREWSSNPVPLVSSTPDFSSKRHNLDWIQGIFQRVRGK